MPEDVAVAGFNDDFGDDRFDPPLTTVRLPIEEMIGLGCKMLIEQFDGLKTEKMDVEMPVELIVRESCGSKMK